VGAFVRRVLLALLLSLLLGFAIGTWLRMRMEAPRRYIGSHVADPPSLALSTHPGDIGHAGAPVLDSGDHEEQV
jgi:hypothetical protein